MAQRHKARLDSAHITARGSVFGINEYSSGFEIVHRPTGKTAWMSDGVDMFTTESGRSIWPGTKAWERAAKNWLRGQGELYEAYFPELDRDKYKGSY